MSTELARENLNIFQALSGMYKDHLERFGEKRQRGPVLCSRGLQPWY